MATTPTTKQSNPSSLKNVTDYNWTQIRWDSSTTTVIRFVRYSKHWHPVRWIYLSMWPPLPRSTRLFWRCCCRCIITMCVDFRRIIGMLIETRIMCIWVGWVCSTSRSACLWDVLISTRGKSGRRSTWGIHSKSPTMSYSLLSVPSRKQQTICGIRIGLLPRHWDMCMDGRYPT